jgi:hypothetical protein
MHPVLLATALSNRGDPRVFQEFIGILESFSIFPEGDE